MRVFTGVNDLTLYDKFADQWWERGGRSVFRSLQGITKFRLALIDEWCGSLAGQTVIDLGCGGGLLAAPLSAGGAAVVGMDLSLASLRAAKAESKLASGYIQGDMLRLPIASGSADVVLLADVLDHIPNYQQVLAEARRVVKRDGKIFVSTINRNFWSWILAIQIGENIGLIPKGTHDYRLFIRPMELKTSAMQVGLRVVAWKGEQVDLLKTIRGWAIHFVPSRSLRIAYSALMTPA